MKSISNKINSWANAFVVFAVFFFACGVVGFFLNSAWTSGVFGWAILSTILSPLFSGFAILVKNAEEELEQRWMVNNKNAKNEDEK